MGGIHEIEGGVDKEVFLWQFLIQNWEKCFGPVWRVMLSGKSKSTKQLDYVNFIINYLKNRRLEGLERA